MRTVLRFLALGISVVGTVFWLFGGPNVGWTKTSVAVPKKDPITELDYVEWQRNFVPGVDFMAGCVAVSSIVFAASWMVRQQTRNQSKVKNV